MLAHALATILDHPFWIFPIMVGIACAGLALVMGRNLLARRRPDPGPATPKPKPDPTPVADPFVHGSATERRNALRRGGNPTPVLVTDQERTAEPFRAWVLDRSTGGLCLAVAEEVKPGTIFSVRAVNAPKTVPWVQVEVKSSREIDGNWELGCQFVKTPTWNVLLLFG
jgi:hypothetical protein